MLKKILLILVSLFIICSCAIQRQYSSYNNVSIYDNLGNKEYYSNVQVKTYEVTDTLSVITFVDRNNHIYTICGKNIVIETIVLERSGYNTRYIYYESTPRILYPHTYYRSNWYYHNPPRRYYYRSTPIPPRHNYSRNNYPHHSSNNHGISNHGGSHHSGSHQSGNHHRGRR